MGKLKIKYGDFSYGGIDMEFYFDDVLVQKFWFSLCTDSFVSITKFLEQFIDGDGSKIVWQKKQLSENQRTYKSLSTTLDGEGPCLDLKLEEIQTAIPCDGGTAYNYDTVRLTVGGYEGHYLENEMVEHVMMGDKNQIIGEFYFSLMNLLGFVVAQKKQYDEYADQDALQDYNDCKSLKIEEFLYPELRQFYTDEKTKIHLKQQIIRTAKIIKKSESSVGEAIAERLNAPKDCELFYQFDESDSEIESIHSMKMVLPVENAEQLFLVPIGGLEN